MNQVKLWLKAFRLRTLPLALSSIFMGSFLAYSRGDFQWLIFILCVLTTIFLQVLSNVANDYGDSVHGADSIHRTGPKRTVQAGEISKAQMKTAVAIFVSLSLLSGVSLLLVAFGWNWKAIVFFFGVGVLSIVAAITYTVGRKPYGYAGLGDISVLIFFGVVGVVGSSYLYSKNFYTQDLLPAVSCGVFAMAVLNVNNIRDIDSDKLAGKFSIPVRIGKQRATRYHLILLLIGVISAITYVVLNYQSVWQWLFLLSLPLFTINARAVLRKKSAELDPYLKQMALSTLLFVLLFGIGLVVA